MTLARSFASIKAITIAELQHVMIWRGAMMLSILTGPLFILVNAIVWKGLFVTSTSGVIGGYTYEAMVSYFATIILIQYLTWNNIEEKVMAAISEGNLSQYILKPYSFFSWLLNQVAIGRVAAFVIEFIPVVLVVKALDIPFTIAQPGWFIVFASIGVVVTYLMNLMLGMLAFWLTKPRGIIWTWIFLKGFLLGMFIPLSVFPAKIQSVLSFTPFPYFLYVPTRIAMGLPILIGGQEVSTLVVALVGLANVACMFIIAKLMWHQGIRRYTGVGQ